jgi:lipoyl-dependent peroxiredoxin
MIRTASAAWQGDLKSGKGTVSTESGVMVQTQYSCTMRFD